MSFSKGTVSRSGKAAISEDERERLVDAEDKGKGPGVPSKVLAVLSAAVGSGSSSLSAASSASASAASGEDDGAEATVLVASGAEQEASSPSGASAPAGEGLAAPPPTGAPATDDKPPPTGLAALGSAPYIVFWVLMSMSVILFNKYLYSGTFQHPLTLTSLHMLFAATVTTALRLSGRLVVPAFPWPLYVRTVLPIGVLFACSLGLSNIGAMRLSVPFVQMCKALTPMLTLAFSVLMGLEQPTTGLAIIVSFMTFGVLLSSLGEIHFEVFGFACQLASIVCEACRLVTMQVLLQEHLPKNPSPLVALSLFTPCSFLFLLPVALYNEPTALPKLATLAVGLPVALNTATAFMLNVAVVMLIGATSSLTLTLAGIVKDIMLISSSVFLFGSPITYLQVCGYLVALYGLNCYNIYKSCKGKIDTAKLLHEGATNRSMAVMAVGMVCLGFIARPK